MLSEIAISPSAFRYAIAKSDIDWIRELNSLLFPRSCDVPIAISEDSCGHWRREIGKAICLIPDSNKRYAAQALLSKLINEPLLVSRKLSAATPDFSDEEWFKALESANTNCHIKAFLGLLSDPTNLRFKPEDITDEYFDQIGQSQANVPCNVAFQESALQSVLAHADFLVIRFPQIRGGGDDEIFSVRSFAGLMDRDGCLSVRPKVVKLILNPFSLKANTISNLLTEIENWKLSRVSVQLYEAEMKYLNRELIAGKFVNFGAQLVEKPRWYITMQHVATQHRLGETDQNTWSFFGAKKAFDRIEELSLDRLKFHGQVSSIIR